MTGTELALSWAASVPDAFHAAAAYYRIYRSTEPGFGFAEADTAAATSTALPQEAALMEFFKIVAVNAAGTSGDEPPP